MTPEQLEKEVMDLKQKVETMSFRLLKAIEGKRHTQVTNKTREKILKDLKIKA